MRFAIPDSDSDDDVAQDISFASDAFNDSPARAGPSRIRTPGHLVPRNLVDGYDSEDEVEMMGLGGVPSRESSDVYAWRSPSSSNVVGPDRARNLSSPSPSRYMSPSAPKSTSKLKTTGHARGEYEAMMRSGEEAAWREGQKIARSRRAHLREIALNARAELEEEHAMKASQDAEEMRRMLEEMTIKQAKEAQEAQRVFKEREKKLWADIDAAIKRTEELEKQRKDLELAARRKAEDEEVARRLASERAAATAKERADEQRRQAESQARDAELARARAAEEAAKKKEEEEARKRAADQRSHAGAEWRKWVEQQRWIKSEVVEQVKQGGKGPLRQGMRLITRGLGQVVNTRESVVRVTEDIAAILNAQLPTPPSAASPSILSQPGNTSQAYLYLLSHLSKGLIKQAETEVSAKADAAFPLARIVLGLALRGHGALGTILFARLVKKCPWVVPFYPSRQQGQSREAYEKSTGRGTDESVSDYIQRMSGICTLYFAILQTPLTALIPTLASPPTPEQLLQLVPLPLRLPAGWTWLALALRDPMPSLPPVCQLVSVWIEVCGWETARVYGQRQVGKVYDAIKKEGVQAGRVKGDGDAARQRLDILLEGWKSMEEPKGRQWDEQ